MTSETEPPQRPAGEQFDFVDPALPEARACVEAYLRELDQIFPTGFLEGVPPSDDANFRAPGGAFLLVHRDARAVACAAVQTLSPGIGEIKRMWVDQSFRGTGLAQRMLHALEARAVALGHHCVRLDTSGHLAAARKLYARAGYREIDAYNDNPHAHHWFEKSLAARQPQNIPQDI